MHAIIGHIPKIIPSMKSLIAGLIPDVSNSITPFTYCRLCPKSCSYNYLIIVVLPLKRLL